jgi:hypothetical protein
VPTVQCTVKGSGQCKNKNSNLKYECVLRLRTVVAVRADSSNYRYRTGTASKRGRQYFARLPAPERMHNALLGSRSRGFYDNGAVQYSTG